MRINHDAAANLLKLAAQYDALLERVGHNGVKKEDIKTAKVFSQVLESKSNVAEKIKSFEEIKTKIINTKDEGFSEDDSATLHSIQRRVGELASKLLEPELRPAELGDPEEVRRASFIESGKQVVTRMSDVLLDLEDLSNVISDNRDTLIVALGPEKVEGLEKQLQDARSKCEDAMLSVMRGEKTASIDELKKLLRTARLDVVKAEVSVLNLASELHIGHDYYEEIKNRYDKNFREDINNNFDQTYNKFNKQSSKNAARYNALSQLFVESKQTVAANEIYKKLKKPIKEEFDLYYAMNAVRTLGGLEPITFELRATDFSEPQYAKLKTEVSRELYTVPETEEDEEVLSMHMQGKVDSIEDESVVLHAHETTPMDSTNVSELSYSQLNSSRKDSNSPFVKLTNTEINDVISKKKSNFPSDKILRISDAKKFANNFAKTKFDTQLFNSFSLFNQLLILGEIKNTEIRKMYIDQLIANINASGNGKEVDQLKAYLEKNKDLAKDAPEWVNRAYTDLRAELKIT